MPRRLSVHHGFNLDKVLNGTQDFRWRPWKDGWHSGVLCRNLVHIRQNGNDLEYRANSDLDDLLTSYFRLDVNLQTIYDDIASRDDKVARLVKEYPHLRVLRQPDPLGVHGLLHLLGQFQYPEDHQGRRKHREEAGCSGRAGRR